MGKYYVRFDQEYKKEVQALVAQGMDEEAAKNEADLMKSARDYLAKWESNDAEIVALWKTMNGWVYKGFEHTYHTMGVSFDKLYYESDTYNLGKDVVQEGLQKGVFYTPQPVVKFIVRSIHELTTTAENGYPGRGPFRLLRRAGECARRPVLPFASMSSCHPVRGWGRPRGSGFSRRSE